ncbi:hypothetical protein DK842_18410 [Chromobacterium phragmitis]|uniref:SnoaL-like domain-containing protein n=1 Tax=Chromobacterium phragmitis TaxID=2202141 RepID=A0A344UCN1_9NEIS|nr:hypothetical protein [Chromobacterium phragmitis]AXE31702.1 hypothetical protein DK842_18410 [Chromobacterium phragmitis]AXE33029.1 hypothetical protein DK843_01070 [Chromobacterium phragmitis]
MNLEMLTQPAVRLAIEALQDGDHDAWMAQFHPEATMTDDGLPANFLKFSEHAIGHERFTSIDRVENQGLDIYGGFHSDRWGDFNTYFKFHLDANGKINLLEIGQAN